MDRACDKRRFKGNRNISERSFHPKQVDKVNNTQEVTEYERIWKKNIINEQGQ